MTVGLAARDAFGTHSGRDEFGMGSSARAMNPIGDSSD
jgi:hypothetical protein